MHVSGRRHFLKNAAILAPVLTLLPTSLSAITSTRLRIGFIGAGPWGRQYLHWALQHRQLDVRAVCESNTAALQACKPLLNGTAYTPDACNDYQELLSRKDLDAVIIAAPWDQHYTIAKAALMAGKHVACGPVMGTTVEEHEDIIRTSERTNRQYFTLDEHSYRPDLMAISNMAEKGLFGTPESIHAGAHYQTLTPAHTTNPLPYPVFPAAAIAGILGMRKGNKYVSLQVQPQQTEYVINKLHPKTGQQRMYIMRAQLDLICLTTAQQQTVYLQSHAGETQPLSTGFRVKGSNGHWMDVARAIHIKGQSPENFMWEPVKPYLEQYDDPQWNESSKVYKQTRVPDGCAYALNDFVQLLQQQTYRSVYNAATNSVIGTLAAISKANGGAPVTVPGFSAGKKDLV
jgi:hypothetical protein